MDLFLYYHEPLAGKVIEEHFFLLCSHDLTALGPSHIWNSVVSQHLLPKLLILYGLHVYQEA